MGLSARKPNSPWRDNSIDGVTDYSQAALGIKGAIDSQQKAQRKKIMDLKTPRELIAEYD